MAKTPADQHVAIIGAGIGGLTAAVLLAAQGVRVSLFEKEARPGGKARRVTVEDVEVEAGPTVFTLRDVFDGIFDAAGASLDDHLRVRPADVLARHGWSDGERLDLHADHERSVEAVGDFAGAEAARGYRAFSKEAKRLFEALDEPFLRGGKTDPLTLTARVARRAPLSAFNIRPYETMWKALQDYFHDPRLIQLFGRYATYCGSDPFRTPATLMLIAHVEAKGVWLVEGGISALADAMANLAERLGATIHYRTPVSRIDTAHGKVSGLMLANGEHVAADAVIANADPSALARGLFGAAAAHSLRGTQFKDRSLSALVWAGYAETEGFPLSRHNVFFSDDYVAEFDALRHGRVPDHPSVYVCAQDRGADDEPPHRGRERLQIIVNAPANGDVYSYNEGERERCTAQMEAMLARTGLRLEPDWPYRLATPNRFNALFPATGGALYGRASHGWAASFLRPSARTKIPGLYCAGGATHPGAGVPMAALSGRLAAETLMRGLASTSRSRRKAIAGGMSTPSAMTDASASPSSPS